MGLRDLKESEARFAAYMEALFPVRHHRGPCATARDVAAKAMSSRSIEALKRGSIAYRVDDRWVSKDEVNAAQTEAEQSLALSKQQALNRRQRAEDARKVAAIREADKAQTNAARQAALRQQFGAIATATAASIADDVKRFTEGSAGDQPFTAVFPAFSSWYQGLLTNHWQLMTLNSKVADYGSVVWKNRTLTAGLAKVSIRLRNRLLGEYKQACFEFGRVIDQEFHMNRDSIAVRCNDDKDLVPRVIVFDGNF